MDDLGDVVEAAAKLPNVDFGKLEQSNGLPSGIMTRLVKTESNFNPAAVSPKGAIGLAQLMPDIIRAYGVKNPTDPVENATAGAKYLGDLVKQYGGNVNAAVAHYNGGTAAGKAVLSGQQPPSAETQAYVPKVAGSAPEVPFSDFADTIEQAAKAQPTAPAKSDVQAPAAQVEKPGAIISALAGAGEATGRGALAVQQIVGKGASWLGDLIDNGTVSKAGNWLQQDALEGVKKLEAENAPYAETNPKSNIAGQVAGIVLSPVNKIIPGGGPATSLIGAAAKGAVQGAALNALTAPVTNEDQPFLLEKLKQAGIGAVGGAAGGSIGYGIGKLLDKAVQGVQRLGNRAISGNPGAAAEEAVNSTLSSLGIPADALKIQRPALFDGLKTQVQDAIQSGQKVDPKALERLAQSQTLPVPVPLLKGQITRNPMQYAMEQNLRGIQGVGEPVQQVLQDQNRALIGNLDALGAKNAPDVVSAGQTAIQSLQKADEAAKSGVTAAYNAFKVSTGKELDVPLAGLSQDYAKTVSEFGDAIPSVIKAKFEGLGLLSGTAKKTFSITDAENLIKSINRNYDPTNLVQARALNELRSSVQSAISEGAGSNAIGGEAAALAKAARGAAAARFKAIDQTPALEAAIRGEQPDKFIQKFILNGNQAQVKSMMDAVQKSDPQAAASLQDSVMGFIKDRVLNGRTDQNAAFSADQLKRFVGDANMSARLKQVLGEDKLAQLRQLYEVAENANYAPVSSAVNRSNTASAAANIVKGELQGGTLNSLADIAKNIPGLSTAANAAQTTLQARRAANLVNEAVNPSVSQPYSGTRLADILGLNVPARTGAAYVAEKSRRKSPQ